MQDVFDELDQCGNVHAVKYGLSVADTASPKFPIIANAGGLKDLSRLVVDNHLSDLYLGTASV